MVISNILLCALLWPQERNQKLFPPLTEIMPFKFEYNLNIEIRILTALLCNQHKLGYRNMWCIYMIVFWRKQCLHVLGKKKKV